MKSIRLNYEVVLILLILFGSVTFCWAKFVWTDADYEKYDYKTFVKLPAVNERIDMRRVNYPLLNAAVFYETNRWRTYKGRQALKHSPALEKAAQGHSKDMVKYNFYSHSSRLRSKRTLKKRLAKVGIHNAYIAENIARVFGIEYKSGYPIYMPHQNGGYFSYRLKGKPIKNHTYIGLAKGVVRAWMNSPGHRENILNSKYKYMGAGCKHYRDASFDCIDKFRMVQNFSSAKGKP